MCDTALREHSPYLKLLRACAFVLLQVYQQGKGLPFHFDKDEHLFKEQHKMVHPMLSSVLYLTGATAAPKRLGESETCCAV